MVPTLFVILTLAVLYWFPIRRWMSRWGGATPSDRSRVMAGDSLLVDPTYSELDDAKGRTVGSHIRLSGRVGIHITPENGRSQRRVFTDYDLPTGCATYLLGFLFGGVHANWCVAHDSSRGGSHHTSSGR